MSETTREVLLDVAETLRVSAGAKERRVPVDKKRSTGAYAELSNYEERLDDYRYHFVHMIEQQVKRQRRYVLMVAVMAILLSGIAIASVRVAFLEGSLFYLVTIVGVVANLFSLRKWAGRVVKRDDLEMRMSHVLVDSPE